MPFVRTPSRATSQFHARRVEYPGARSTKVDSRKCPSSFLYSFRTLAGRSSSMLDVSGSLIWGFGR
jgi:hypothetical protein